MTGGRPGKSSPMAWQEGGGSWGNHGSPTLNDWEGYAVRNGLRLKELMDV